MGVGVGVALGVGVGLGVGVRLGLESELLGGTSATSDIFSVSRFMIGSSRHLCGGRPRLARLARLAWRLQHSPARLSPPPSLSLSLPLNVRARGVPGVCQGCARGSARGVPGVCQGCARGVPGVCQGCARGVTTWPRSAASCRAPYQPHVPPKRQHSL